MHTDHRVAVPPMDASAHDLDHHLLRLLGLVDAAPENAFDKFTRLVRTATGAPVALVSFVEESLDRQYFKSQIGLPGKWATYRQTPLSHSVCQLVKRDNRPLVVEDAQADDRVRHNRAVQDLGMQAYLGTAIHSPDGKPLGAICAIDTLPRIWAISDIEFMVDIAACVSDQIKLRTALHKSLRP